MLEFRLLGQLEVVEHGRVISVPAGKQRALLAVLLMHANEVVSTDLIADELWAEQPPTAGAAIQNGIARLRKALGPDRIERRPPGYLLRADPDEIDAARFERLVGEALASDEPARRAATLDEALALWRGPALADVAFEAFAQDESRRLDDLRVAALEHRIEADLALGRHDEAVAELEGLVRRNPLRERLCGLLMLALYRAGRQADALRAFQELRRRLIDDLGLEPAAELKRLEHAILVHDPSLEAARPPAAEGRPPRGARTAVREGRRTATALFADLTGSTALGEKLDPESLRELVGRFFAEMAAAVERHGGTVEKFAGDSVLAVFGVPTVHEDDALRAVLASIEMRTALEALNADAARAWGVELELRIGINTGEIVAGDTSAGHAFVTGDAVNTAKRLEEGAAPGETLLGSATERLVRHAIEGAWIEPLEAHGKAEPVRAYRLAHVRDSSTTIPRRLEAPLVDRVDELAALRRELDATTEARRCRLVAVVGEPGIGKTRLVAELTSGLGSEATVLTGRCVAYGEGASYLPLAELVREAAGPDPRSRIGELLRGDEAAELVAARVAEAIGAADGAAPTGETFWAFRRFLEGLAGTRPLVAVLEDVHWAEPTLLDLVEYLVGWSDGAPILLVCLARPELLAERGGWATGGAAIVSLEPLADADAERLVDGLARETALGAGERALVVRRAEGNALFIEHLLADVLERGGVAGGVVPPSIEALLAGRLDRLAPEERDVLERAAVVGRAFWRGAVDDLTPADARAAVGGHLMALVRRGLILPDRSLLPGQDGFRFQHALIRDVAYAQVTKARRRDLHRRLAAWLDAHALQPEELVGTHLELAYRYRVELAPVDDEARELGREAGERLGGAGVRAWKRGDVRAAVNLLSRATSLLPEREPYRIGLLCELGAALPQAGDPARGAEMLAEAAALADTVRDARLSLRARIELAWLRVLRGEEDLDELLALLDRSVSVFEGAADDRALGRGWLLTAYIRGILRAEYELAESAAERAVEHYVSAGYTPSRCFSVLATVVQSSRSVPDAAVRLEELLERPEADRLARGTMQLTLGRVEAMRGRFDVARELAERGRDVTLELGYRSVLLTGWPHSAAAIESLAGDLAAAERVLREALDACAEDTPSSWRCALASSLADVVCRRGRYEEALELTDAGRPAEAGDLRAQVAWRRVRGTALAGTGAVAEGEALVREAIALLESTGDETARAEALLALAKVIAADGRAGEARRAAAEAERSFERQGHVVGARDAASFRGAERAPARGSPPGGGLPGRAGKAARSG